MRKHIYNLLKKVAGVILIIAGVISGFIPIVQGWVLVLAGLLLLGVKKEDIKKFIKKIKEWFRKSRKD